MKRKIWLDVLVAATAAFLSTAALADCRVDPREVHFASDSAARFKSYRCKSPGAALSEEINVEFYSFTFESSSMIASGHPPSTLSPVLGRFSTFKTRTLDEFKSLVDRYGIPLSLDGAMVDVNVDTKDVSGGPQTGKINTVRIDDHFDYPAIEQLQLDKHVVPERMNIFYVGPDSPPHAIFWRYGTLQDVIDLPSNARAIKSSLSPDEFFWMGDGGKLPTTYSKYLGLLSYLSSGDKLPTDFLLLYGYFGQHPELDNCSDGWHFAIVSPRLALEALLIRNTSSQDIRIDSLLGQETGDMRLRRSESSVQAPASDSAAIRADSDQPVSYPQALK
jgi:hypothetical protein